ncbi:MAG TPA: type I glutamate--ammonia ligase [Acidimicrobiales bacterium]|nr:type I glutamate--ammonia ligase [Acidimicrobiales bacterium]
MISDESIEIVDLRFCDLPGLTQHFSMPAGQLTADVFDEGVGFDGSSIRGFQEIQESDMLLIPDPGTAVVDPFTQHKTLNLNCFVNDPVTGESYSRDPRYVARKAEEYLRSTGIADTCYVGPEAEFFIFDDVRFDQNEHEGYYHIESIEAAWNTGREENPNLGYKPRYKEGYFPVPPMDHFQDLRSEMILLLEKVGVEIEIHHHEVGTAGQAEIDMRFDSLLRMADKLMLYKYVVKNVARQAGKTATFMPKPVFQDNGSGMHTHQSLWRGGEPLFYSEAGYAGLSDMGRWYIGGLLTHAPAILAFSNPTTNSYKRLVPGYEAPVNLVYSQRNRSAAVRIPLYSQSPKAKRLEFRCPDPSCNPYLAFSAMLMAGLDGIQNRIEPPDPVDKDLYDLPPEELSKVPQVPGSLDAVLSALEEDQAFLKAGGVFTDDLIETWITYKRESEVDALRLRPHPWEFALYYDL